MKTIVPLFFMASIGTFAVYFTLYHIAALFKTNTLMTAYAMPNFAEDVDEFDQEFNILIESDAEKAVEAERLRQVEDEINMENAKFAKGEANFGERLYPWSDWAKEDFESQKLGAIAPETRSMGLVMPPESERNTPENQAKLDALYSKIADRGAAPSSYFSNSKGLAKSF